MAWDVDGRRSRVMAAAVEEFAERGFSGGSTDRIAHSAGVNKERVYSYFGSKRALFGAVLSDQLNQLAQAVPLEITTRDSLAHYSGQVFDYHVNHPHLLRLLYWEALESAEDLAEASLRSAYYRSKAATIKQAQADGHVRQDLDPGQLLCTLVASCAWPLGVPGVAKMMTRHDLATPSGRRRQRAAIMAIVRAMTAPEAAAGATR